MINKIIVLIVGLAALILTVTAMTAQNPATIFLEAIPSSIVVEPSRIPGNVTLESQDGKTMSVPRGAAEQSETLKNVISETGTTQPLPVNLTGDLFMKLVNALKDLYEYQTVNVYQLSYPLEPILSGMSFNDLLSLFKEGSRLNIAALTWYMAALFATELYQRLDEDLVAAMTKEIASAVNASDLVTTLLNNVLDKKIAESLVANIKILAAFEIPIKYSRVALKELPNKNLVALTGSEDGIVYFWNLTTSTEEPEKILKGHSGGISALAFSPDGNFALSGSHDSMVRYWDLTSGKSIKAGYMESHILSIALSQDNKYALTGLADNTVPYWDLKTGKARLTMSLHAPAKSVAISHDSQKALTSLIGDNNVYLWDLQTGTMMKTLKGHLSAINLPDGGKMHTQINAVTFSSDDQYALTGSDDQKAIVWDLTQGGKELTPFKILGNAGSVGTVAFSADGKRALTASRNTTRIWDLDTQKPLAVFRVFEKKVDQAIFGEQSIFTVPHTSISGIVHQLALRNLNRLPQVILFIKAKQLSKHSILKNTYFKQIYDELPISLQIMVSD